MPAENQLTTEALERQLPLSSADAFSKAQQAALRAGLSVVVSKGQGLFCVGPDGNGRFVKMIERPVKVEIGKKYLLP